MLDTHTHTYPSLLCWLRLSSVYVCVSVCDAGDGGENPAFWNIPVRWRENLSGRSWTAWDHKDTHKLREKEWRSLRVQPSTKKKTHREKNPVPLVLLGGNTTRTRLRTETFNGAIVSGTWPDPDPFYRTKLLEVCQSHLRTHTNGDGQPWCYSGAYFYPCCSRDYFLTRMTSKTNRSGDVISQPGHLCPEQALHTHSYTPWYLAKRAFLQTHTHIQILTSRSVNAECC